MPTDNPWSPQPNERVIDRDGNTGTVSPYPPKHVRVEWDKPKGHTGIVPVSSLAPAPAEDATDA